MDIRPLFVAYACKPGHGSEPGVGWNFVAEAARHRPVWVITHEENRAKIEAHLAACDPRPAVFFRYVKLPRPLRRLEAGGYVGFNVAYYLWNVLAGRQAVRWHEEVGFTLVQHVSLVRWWMPTAAARLASRGVRFVWGPVGAGEGITPGLERKLAWRHRAMERARRWVRAAFRADPRLAATARAADLALAGTREVEKHLRRLGVKRVELMPAVAIEAGRLPLRAGGESAGTSGPEAGRPFIFCSGGGLIYWKRIDLALRAFAALNLPDAEYHHVCGGQEQPRLEALARELGIADRVSFLGEMDYRQCCEHMARVDVLVHPALRDSCGLILEAFGSGVPVIAFDVGTAGLLVDETCGATIPTAGATEADLLAALTENMRIAYADAGLRATWAAGAAARSGVCSREERGRRLEAIWAELHAPASREQGAQADGRAYSLRPMQREEARHGEPRCGEASAMTRTVA
ncbi:MAG: glycosyltransferase [Phycisphaerae bacterium]